MHKMRYGLGLIAMFSIFLVMSCTVSPTSLTIEEQIDLIERDLEAVFATQEPVTQKLSLYDAMARSVRYNLDYQASQVESLLKQGDMRVEKLKMLPELNASYAHAGRTNQDVITLESMATGNPALEPSRQDDHVKQVGRLELSWNILDFGLSYARAKQKADQAMIAEERQRKELQKLLLKTRVLYWKAASADEILPKVDQLMKKAKANLDKSHRIERAGLKPPMEVLTYQAELLDTLRRLLEQRKDLIAAKSDLASLINLPYGSTSSGGEHDIELDPIRIRAKDTVLDLHIHDMELFALMNRPEMREAQYKDRIAASKIREEVLDTLPGLNISTSASYDSNSLLDNTRWVSLAAGFSDNLMKIFTLDARKARAETHQKLVEMQRHALAASILAQVQNAHALYEVTQKDFDVYRKLNTVHNKIVTKKHAMKKAGSASGVESLQSEMESLIAKIRYHRAYTELAGTHGQVLLTMGADLVPETYGSMTTEKLAETIQNNFDKIDRDHVAQFMKSVRANLGRHKPVVKNNKLIKKEKKIAIPPLDYMGIDRGE